MIKNHTLKRKLKLELLIRILLSVVYSDPPKTWYYRNNNTVNLIEHGVRELYFGGDSRLVPEHQVPDSGLLVLDAAHQVANLRVHLLLQIPAPVHPEQLRFVRVDPDVPQPIRVADLP